MSKRANGENTIYFRADKKLYCGQVSAGFNENGKIKRKTVYGKTKTEVREKMKQIEAGLLWGNFIDKSSITIYQIGKQMLDDEMNARTIKENTYRTNIDALKRLAPIYNTPIQKATEMQIKDFLLSEQSYSQSVINKDYILLKRIFAEATKKDIIKKNLLDGMRKPNTKKKSVKVRALTIDEQKKLVDVLSNNDILYSNQMLLSMFTGLRMGEVNALRKSDINMNFNCINVARTMTRNKDANAVVGEDTKTRAGARVVKFDANVKKLLQECITYAEGNELLFTRNNDGKSLISSIMVNDAFKRVIKKYDIADNSIEGNISAHSLRHTYATRCIEAGMQANVLQKLLGHTSITVTINTYCDVFDKYKENNIDMVNKYMREHNITA